MEVVSTQSGQHAGELRQRQALRRHGQLQARVAQIVLDGAVDRHLALRGLERELLHVDAVVALAEPSAEFLEREVWPARAHRHVVEREAVMHRFVLKPRLQVQTGDLLRQRVAR